MGAGRKLGYAAALAGGLLAATAWAAAAQNLCVSSFGLSGLTFPSGCDNPDDALAIPAETACNNLYTQGYWSNPALAGGAGEHEQHEANLIRAGLRRDDWSTGVVGGINWEFDADTETVKTPWGYQDPAMLAQTIADYNTLITNVQAALITLGADLALADVRDNAAATRDTLDDLQAGGHQVPYYVDLPYWVDHRRATPPSFDPNLPAYQATLDPLPETLTADVGYFTATPPWNPTLIPALEILKCEGWSATDFTASPVKYDDAGIVCPTPSSGTGWSSGSPRYSSGTCYYSKPARYWRDPPGRYVYYTASTTELWQCNALSQTIEIDGTDIRRTLSGSRAYNHSTGDFSCRYTFPRSVLNNFSSQLDQFDVDLGTSSQPPVSVTIGHDITADTFRMATTPIGWAVRWIEHTRPRWPLGCTRLGPAHQYKPCWDTFDPDVRMAPRLDQLTVGTPTWVWLNDVSASCLPDALPTPPSPDCNNAAQASVWEAWPRDEADPNMWRRAVHPPRRAPWDAPGAFWRAAFPQKVSIKLTHNTTGVSHTYECWTDPTYQPGRSLLSGGAGEWAPGQRPFSSDPDRPALTGPLATTYGPLNPGVGGLHVQASRSGSAHGDGHDPLDRQRRAFVARQLGGMGRPGRGAGTRAYVTDRACGLLRAAYNPRPLIPGPDPSVSASVSGSVCVGKCAGEHPNAYSRWLRVPNLVTGYTAGPYAVELVYHLVSEGTRAGTRDGQNMLIVAARPARTGVVGGTDPHHRPQLSGAWGSCRAWVAGFGVWAVGRAGRSSSQPPVRVREVWGASP